MDTEPFIPWPQVTKFHILLLWQGIKAIQLSSGLSAIPVKDSLRKNLWEYSWEPWLFGQPVDWLGPVGGGQETHPAGVPGCCPDPKAQAQVKQENSFQTPALYTLLLPISIQIFNSEETSKQK